MNNKKTAVTVAGLLVASSFWLVGPAPGVGAPAPGGEAFVINPFLQNPGKTNMTIRWVAKRPASFSVRCRSGQGEARTYPATLAAEPPRDEPGENEPVESGADAVYSVTLTGLAPDTSYDYEVVSSESSAGGTFRTIPDKPAAFTSFDYGNAHVCCLLSDSTDPKMLEWCRRDLSASKAEWKFVLYHHPSYDLGRYRSAWGRQDYLPIFRANGVDMAFSGHTHGYQRFKPLFTPGENERNPVTYIVTAGGGAPLYPAPAAGPMLAAGAAEYNFAVVTVEGSRISVRALTPDGRELDSFSYSKKNGTVEPAWRALAKPETEFVNVRDGADL